MERIIMEVPTTEDGMASYWNDPSHDYVNIEFIGEHSDEAKNFIVIRPEESIVNNDIQKLRDLFLPIKFEDAKIMAKNILSIIQIIENNQKS